MPTSDSFVLRRLLDDREPERGLPAADLHQGQDSGERATLRRRRHVFGDVTDDPHRGPQRKQLPRKSEHLPDLHRQVGRVLGKNEREQKFCTDFKTDH